MASEKSISAMTMLLTTLLLMIMYSTDVALAQDGACELKCRAACILMKSYYQACYHGCVALKCHEVVVPTLDAPYDPVSDPQTQCKMECVSSKCMDSRADAKKTTDCVTSCDAECDNGTN